jgi:signal transduction histidine kinase
MDQPSINALIVGASADDSAALARLLGTGSRSSFTLERVTGVEASLERLGRGDVRAVIVAVDGDARLDDIATLRARADVPIVALIRDAGAGAALAALHAGAEDVVAGTGLDGDMLARALTIAIARHRAGATERARTEERRRLQTIEALRRIAGGIAHDFNNLLTVISGRVQLLEARLSPNDAPGRDVAIIQATVERAATLARRVLAFGYTPGQPPAAIDVNAVVLAAKERLVDLVGDDIAVRVTPAPDVGHVGIDAAHLDLVLVQLVSNARDAMPHGGRVTITTGNTRVEPASARAAVGVVDGPCVVITVSDTGTGMDADTRALAFEPFATGRSRGERLGLGLATVANIVEHAGGAVDIESEPGYGTTVRVYLPRADDSAPSGAPRVSGRGSCISRAADVHIAADAFTA